MVYFVKDSLTNCIKIGYAKSENSFRLRFNTLNVMLPSEPEILCLLKGDTSLEKQLHTQFSYLHKKGEWFFDNGDISNFLKDKESYVFKNRDHLLTKEEALHFFEVLIKYGSLRNILLFKTMYYARLSPTQVHKLVKGDLQERGILVGGILVEVPLVFLTDLKAYCAADEVTNTRIFNISVRQINRLWGEYRPCKKPISSLRKIILEG